MTGIENLLGSFFDDELEGDAGNNQLQGYGGADRLRGGAGADYFVYTALFDSTGAAIDRIYDFSTLEGDKIELSDIDANTNTTADDAFNFIGNRNFSGVAGELKFSAGLLEGDVNGDMVADLRIAFAVTTLAATDFIL